MKTVVAGLLVIGLAIGGTMYYTKYVGAEPTSNFKTTPVKRGDLLITIGATGTLEPEEVIDVGAQVQGRVLEFGKDPRADNDPRYKNKHVDYNTPVEDGTVLAQIDDSIYRATRDQAKASLDRAKADLIQLESKREQADQEWVRAQKLHDIKLPSLAGITTSSGQSATTIKGISDSDYSLAKANFEVAKANEEVGKTAITQAQAALSQAETNLSYTTIKSPVKGQIIDRRVNIGQTVVASLSAPSIFLIGKDLRRMEVWALVNEADIGRIKLDMPVHFTVDAFPNDTFHGTVSQVRLNAAQNQNVVLYTVVATTDNSDLKLLPYLTADVKFEINERKDVLLVPNAALTWQPRPQHIAPDSHESATSEGSTTSNSEGATAATSTRTSSEQAEKGEKTADSEPPKKGPAGEKRAAGEGRGGKRQEDRPNRGTLWIKDEQFVRPIEVEVGPTDGLLTEVSGNELNEGLEVVYGENRENAFSETKNPFAPQFFRGGRGGGGGGRGGGGGGGGIGRALRGG